MKDTQVKLSCEQLERFLHDAFPETAEWFSVDEVTADGLNLGVRCTDRHTRPGGTVSGPMLMTIADTAMYLALLSRIGLKPMAVTSDLHMRFLRKPLPGQLVAQAKLLKIGTTLAVGEVSVVHISQPDACLAHATVTYAIPREDTETD